MKIETKMTVSELREACRAANRKVELHFTAKGNPAWRSFYRYGRNDREIGTVRLTKREADERLAEFGLTANLVIEIAGAINKAQTAKTAAMRESGELYTGGRNCHELTDDEVNAIYAQFTKAEITDTVEEAQGYIFTVAYLYVKETADMPYSKVEFRSTPCKILGDRDNFNNSVYREVCFFNEERARAWNLKTADGKFIIRGEGKPDFSKIATAVNGTIGTESAINIEEMPATVEDETRNAPAIETKFEVGKTYAQEKTVLFDSQVKITVMSRTKCFVSFQIEGEDEIIKRKVVNEYGIDKKKKTCIINRERR